MADAFPKPAQAVVVVGVAHDGASAARLARALG
jgi:hypothetical protein